MFFSTGYLKQMKLIKYNFIFRNIKINIEWKFQNIKNQHLTKNKRKHC